MNTCPSCGKQRLSTSLTCPECGRFYSKIIELIEQEAELEVQRSWYGRWQRLKQAATWREGIAQELRQITADWSLRTWFTLGVIALFIFALIITVL